jgi:hypothetical protein
MNDNQAATVSDQNPEQWGELGPAMRALPNDRWRAFVHHLVTGKPGHGCLTRAYAAAGFSGTRKTLTSQAHRMTRDERVIAAIAEEARKVIRIGHPEAVNALFGMVRNPEHRDHARAVAMVLDRCDPVVTTQKIDVVHRHESPDQRALEELKALRKLGTPRVTLLELFGPNGLDRLEMLEAAEIAQRAAAARVIEHDAAESANGR